VRTHAQTELLAEALREAGIPHRVRGGTALLERPAVRRALQQLRSAAVPLGTALADLEAGLEADEEERADLDLAEDEVDARLAALAARADVRSGVALVIRMGRDYLRLDPLGGASSFTAWLGATIRAEADSAHSGDAVDVATFHAAKGLEWPIVHLAGLEEGYVPVAHARTAAAKAEEARLLYVAMTRAQRELHLTWAQHRTFAGKVVDRARSPLLAPVPEGPATADDAADGPPSPPVEDWAEELARQRAQLRRGRPRVDPAVAALRTWRDSVARAARVDPEAVLPDHVLARVAAQRPADLAALGAIRGVGTILADRFGPGLLEALASAQEVTGA
jgi:DNA helicase-2/ATP-dependent DNA helicase PcrA